MCVCVYNKYINFHGRHLHCSKITKRMNRFIWRCEDNSSERLHFSGCRGDRR